MKPFVAFFALASASFLGTASHAQKPVATPASANAAPIFCIITGETIASAKDAAGKTTVGGKTYYFCCPGCASKFNKASNAQKAKYAKMSDLRVTQAVLQKPRDAVKAEQKQREKAVPAPAVTKSGLACAITGEAIASPEDAAGGSTQYNGKTYYFCCGRCKAQFDAEPAKYADAADKRAKSVDVK